MFYYSLLFSDIVIPILQVGKSRLLLTKLIMYAPVLHRMPKSDVGAIKYELP